MVAPPTLHTVVLDCPDPLALARFYADLLGLDVHPDSEPDWAWVVVVPGFNLSFQLAPDHVPPQWPDGQPPQQLHLDLWAPDLDAHHERALAIGAVVGDPEDSREKAVSQGFRVYLDPAGHPFCLCQRNETPWE